MKIVARVFSLGFCVNFLICFVNSSPAPNFLTGVQLSSPVHRIPTQQNQNPNPNPNHNSNCNHPPPKPPPLECACGAPITKVMIQEVNRTVMIPEFIPYTKHFARLIPTFVDTPTFVDHPEEIWEAVVVEKSIPVVNLNYSWFEIKKRVPVFHRTTIQIDEYHLDNSVPDVVNQTVQEIPTVVMETQIEYEEEEKEIEELVIEYNVTVLTPEIIEYEDYKIYVDQIFYQDVVEFVEEIQFVNVSVPIWRVEIYDEEFIQKNVEFSPLVKKVEVDEITIRKKSVRIPRIKYKMKSTPILIHDPVEFIREPVPLPEFYNQTVKIPKQMKRMIPVPQFYDVPVEVPTYYKSPCALPKNTTDYFEKILPSVCTCQICSPCPICPSRNYLSQAVG